jgi:hypothetical protein
VRSLLIQVLVRGSAPSTEINNVNCQGTQAILILRGDHEACR